MITRPIRQATLAHGSPAVSLEPVRRKDASCQQSQLPGADHSLSGSRCRGWECTRETSSIVTVWVASGLPSVSRQFQSVSKLPEGSHFSKVTVSACSFHSFWQRPSWRWRFWRPEFWIARGKLFRYVRLFGADGVKVALCVRVRCAGDLLHALSGFAFCFVQQIP